MTREGKKAGFVGGDDNLVAFGANGDFGIGFPVKICHVLIITWRVLVIEIVMFGFWMLGG